MRNLIFAINMTMDGCVDHTKGVVNDEQMEYFTRLTREAGLQIFGRKTYQLMVPYWPEVAKDESAAKADLEFARAFDAIPKIVFSRSLDKVEDKNTRIVRGNLREEIMRLKEEPGKDMVVGGVDVPSQLMELGLIDEFRLMIGPTIAGEGRRLFESVRVPESVKLKLVASKVFESGCVALRYLKQ